MRDVAITGIGQTPVGEHWEKGLRDLAHEALASAFADAQLDPKAADLLIVANSYGATVSSQAQLAALVAGHTGLTGIEAYTVEAGEASGGAALRAGYLAVASGLVETAVVLGVEKSSDMVGTARTAARAVSLDADYEAVHGVTSTALAALLMRRYMHEYGVELAAFEGFSINAHQNGSRNPNAMYRNIIKPGGFAKAPMIAAPVSLFDSAPDADGAAAVILTHAERAADQVPQPVRIAGSGAASDTLALADRPDPLAFTAAARSAERALAQAGLGYDAVSLFELHDAFTIQTALTLEALGLAERGQGWRLAGDGTIGLGGRVPISTFGGLKSRGNPVGASGVYQAVEAVLQLRGAAGANQVANARAAFIQAQGGMASTVVSHLLTRDER
jgi:acetyl-CoA C-acetyltransferase